MTAAKKRSPAIKQLSRWRRPIAVVLGIAACGAIVMALWLYVRPYVEMQPDYMVEAESIEITPPPAWIRSKIVAETIRDAGLPPQLSILDKDTPQQLTRAFALHPWVDKVGNVQTAYPASIKVELTYRRPVAMVEVAEGLLPIDAEGVLLPTWDFSPEEAQQYPRVAGIASRPLKSVGTSWGDPSVTAAGQLAALLLPIAEILPSPTILPAGAAIDPQAPPSTPSVASTGPPRPAILIATRSGTVFIWGATPGTEHAGEKSGPEKVERLRELAKSYGSLDHVPADHRDLR